VGTKRNVQTVNQVDVTKNFLTSPIFGIRVVKGVEGSNFGVIGGNCYTKILFNHVKTVLVRQHLLSWLGEKSFVGRVWLFSYCLKIHKYTLEYIVSIKHFVTSITCNCELVCFSCSGSRFRRHYGST
jgi:hypothetical protein